MSASPAATVIVPTRDRPAALRRCLAALDRQTVADDLEVVVVADGSQALKGAREAVAGHRRVVLLAGAGRGPAAARNRGAEAATAPFLLFTDDDCEPLPSWAEQLLHALRAGASVVAGPTRNARPQDPWGEAAQLVANALVRPLAGRPAEVAFAPSSNLGCRAEVLQAVPFDETFPAPGGEDREWCARLARHGWTIELQTAAVVLHHHERGPWRFWRQQVRYGRGAYRHRQRSGGARRLERGSFYWALLAEGFRRGPAVGGLVATSQVATAVGFLAEWGTLRARARRRLPR